MPQITNMKQKQGNVKPKYKAVVVVSVEVEPRLSTVTHRLIGTGSVACMFNRQLEALKMIGLMVIQFMVYLMTKN